MNTIKYVIAIILVSLIFTGCDTKKKIDLTAKKVEQMEKNQAAMKKELDYYKNKEKEVTHYKKYLAFFILALIFLYITKIIATRTLKLIKRG